jgi:uncharacterized protein (DUF427 family)
MGKAGTNGWINNPGYEIFFDPIPVEVRVDFGGATVGRSTAAHVMYELGHAPMYYLPLDDLDMGLLEPTDHDTYCPYKGHASYWSVNAGGKTAKNAIWTYKAPHKEMAQLKGYAGFYWGRMDGWYEDGEKVGGPREIPGRIDTTTQFKKQFPALAADWHPERNVGISPYEFPATSGTVVWWKDASGREWQESIRDRVLAATSLRTDGDAHPYG